MAESHILKLFVPTRIGVITDRTDVIGLSAFVLSGVLVSWLVDSLQRSHGSLRAVLTSIGDAVITTDREHLVRFMNPQAETLTGWFKSEAENKSVARVLKVNLRETQIEVQKLLAQAMQEGRPVKVLSGSFLARKSGTSLPVDDSIAPIQTRMEKCVEGHEESMRNL